MQTFDDFQKQISKSLEKFYFFEEGYCIPVLEEKDKVKIQFLTEEECSDFWEKYVSKKYDHWLQIPINESINYLNYNWEKDWIENNIEAFDVHIKPLIGYQNNDEVLFFWNKSTGVKTEWNIICKYWITFLFEDEGNILINPSHPSVLYLSTHGKILLKQL
jgi:hypothetical protein